MRGMAPLFLLLLLALAAGGCGTCRLQLSAALLLLLAAGVAVCAAVGRPAGCGLALGSEGAVPDGLPLLLCSRGGARGEQGCAGQPSLAQPRAALRAQPGAQRAPERSPSPTTARCPATHPSALCRASSWLRAAPR